MEQEILLDSGTNEVELLEFFLADQSFAINVSKILQIITYDETKLTAVPDTPDAVKGVLLWRDRTINLIDLHQALNSNKGVRSERPIVLVTGFNDQTNAFLTDGVTKIHRINWSQIAPVGNFLDIH